jgi:DNA-directed RNA polymerase subunit H (RpoH/RPB5)
LETLKDDERVLLKVWQRRDGSSKHHKGWREMRRYRLEEIKIEKANGQTVKVQFGVGCELVARQVKFENPEDALRFHSVVQKVTQLERDRGKCQLEKYRLSQENLASIKYSDHIQVFVEIVSITDIPKDVVPYVAIKLDGKVLHRTGYASSETGSAIYTLKEGCFFVLNMPLLEFFARRVA